MSSDTDSESAAPTATRGTGRAGRADGADEADEADEADGDGTATGESAAEGDDAGGFGSRGWALVVAVVLSTLVIPGVIYLVPTLLPSVGVPYVFALLVLPLVPAGVLGATAVWSMAASGRR